MADLGAPDTSEGTGFSKRLGPLPYWAWIAIVTAGAVVGWVWWRSRKPAASSPQPQLVSASADGLATEQFESLYALIRDLQGQQSTPGDTTPPPMDDKQYIDVPEGTWVSEFFSQHPDLNLSLKQLQDLNPGIILRASDRGYDPHGNRWVINSAGSGGRIRVK